MIEDRELFDITLQQLTRIQGSLVIQKIKICKYRCSEDPSNKWRRKAIDTEAGQTELRDKKILRNQLGSRSACMQLSYQTV